MRAGQSRRHHAGGIAAACLALLIQILLPALHGVAMARQARPPAGGEMTVVICTLYGYQVVPLSKLVGGNTGKSEDRTPPAGQVSRICALCQAIIQADLAPPPGIDLPAPLPAAVAVAPWGHVAGRVLPADPRAIPQPRAPPALHA
ncbi:DUF2946 family protein [Zavarzinia aquatilis]|uniref:DUF2946 domain-containing protein n=1 Tax=Zavarzinia aquatilis TaxID=2211142 RepID=A0A317E5Z2_9PROT|nr:hypothetical protein [Zavarzinia aquatilis]PWR22528.1 hypothetical protein DKG74_11675 [Zavarzinia aquatilis]